MVFSVNVSNGLIFQSPNGAKISVHMSHFFATGLGHLVIVVLARLKKGGGFESRPPLEVSLLTR